MATVTEKYQGGTFVGTSGPVLSSSSTPDLSAGNVLRSQAKNRLNETVTYDIVGLMRQMASDSKAIVEPYAQAKILADTRLGQVQGIDFVEKNSNLTGVERKIALDKEIQDITNSDKSYAYKSAYSSQLVHEYAKAEKEANQEIEVSYLNGAASGWKVIADNKKAGVDTGITAEEYVNIINKETGIDRQKINDAVYTGAAASVLFDISQAKDTKELNDVIQLWEQEKEENFNTPYFRTSKSAKTKAVVNHYDTLYARAIKAKEKEFKDTARANIDKAIQEDYSVHPMYLANDFDKGYTDVLTRGNAIREYTKKYKEAETTRNWFSTYSTDAPHGKVPKVAETKWKEAIYNDALTSLVNGESTKFINIINNNTKYSKDVGAQLYSAYLNETDANKLDPYMKQIESITITPRGATALSTSIGSDNYAEMLTSTAIAKALYDGDMVKARDYVQQQKTNPTKQSWDEDLFKTVNDKSTDLGHLGNQYKATMTTMNNINPLVAKQNEPKIRKYYQGLISKWDTNWYGGGGVTVDTSNGPDITEEAVDADKAKSTIIEVATALNNGQSPATIYMMGDEVFTTDPYGGVGTVLNVRAVVDAVNEEARIEAGKPKLDSAPFPTTKVIEAASTLTVDTMDTIKDFFTNLFKEDEHNKGRLQAIRKLFIPESYDTALARMNTLSPDKQAEYEYAKAKSVEIAKTLNVLNNNPGNLRDEGDDWEGSTGVNKGFTTFDTPQAGVRAMSKVLDTYHKDYGLNTISEIINRWAPPSENNTTNYINTVSNLTGIDADTPLTKDDRAKLIKAMIRMEGGKQATDYYTDDIIKEGLNYGE
jgi:hypothetical protein